MKQSSPILIIIFILTFGCNNYDRTKWTQFQGAGIAESDDSFSTLKFQNDSVGYIGGRNTVFSYDSSHQIKSIVHTTTIYKTVNKGISWRKLNANFEGEIRGFRFKGDSIYVLNQFGTTPPSILLSTDNGSSWTELITFPESTYVRDFNFNAEYGLLVALDNKKYLNLIAISESTDTLDQFSKFHYKITIGINNVFLINPSRGANSDGVIKYNLNRRKKELIEFEADHYVQSTFVTDNDEFYIALEDTVRNSKILKLRKSEFEELNLGEYSEYSLGQLFLSDNKIIVDANKKEGVGPIGVTHEVLISTDGGLTWNVENYPFSLIVKPAEILNNGEFICYQGLREFQKRK